MKNYRHQHLLLIVAALLSVVAAIAERPDNRKTDYVFLQAASYREQSLSDYYMTLRHARSIAPDDPYIAAAIAEIELYLPSTDSANQEKAYRHIADRFYAEPTVQRYADSYTEAASRTERINDIIDIFKTQDSLMPDRSDPAVSLAKAYVQRFRMQGDSADISAALAIYDRLEKAAGPTQQLIMNKIDVLSTLNDTAAILSELKSFEKNAPDNFENNFISAIMFFSLNSPDSALTRLDKAAALDPDAGAVDLYRSYIYRQKGDSARYDKAVQKALEAKNLHFEAKLKLLDNYTLKLSNDTAQWPRIDSLFFVVEQTNPGEPELHELYSSFKESTGQLGEAAEQMSYAVALDPNNQRRWQDLTRLYTMAEDTTASLSTALQAIERFPYAGYFPLVASSVLASGNRQREAVNLLDTVPVEFLETDKVRSVIHSQKGDILWQLDERDKAIESYAKAIEYDSENYMAMNNLSYFLAIENRDLDKAEIYAAIAATAESTNPTILDTYAWVLFVKKNYAKALIYIEAALRNVETDGNDSKLSEDILDHAGDIYYMNGQPDKALEYWKKAAELDPNNAAIQKKIKHKAYFFD